MKFRLTDKDKATVHEGVMPRAKAPDAVSWGSRAFVRAASPDGTATYREVETFRIGEFR